MAIASGCLLIYLCLAVFQVNCQKSVTYRIQFSPDCSGVSPPERIIDSPYTSTAMDIMERARDQFGSDYNFEAKYFGVSTGGYFIQSISGRPNSSPCFWFFYIEAPGESEFKPPIGVTTYVPGDNFIFTMRMEMFISSPSISSTLSIMYVGDCADAAPESLPPSRVVSIPENGTALDVMQAAEDGCGFTCACSTVYDYSFVVTYEGDTTGFLVDAVNNVANSETCEWVMYIENPDGVTMQGATSPSNQQIPGAGYTVIWRYMQPESPTTSRVTEWNTKYLYFSLLCAIVMICGSYFMF